MITDVQFDYQYRKKKVYRIKVTSPVMSQQVCDDKV